MMLRGWAIPVNPALLQQLLDEGDTLRYEQMLRRSRLVNRRMPKHPLVEQAYSAAPERKQANQSASLAQRGLLILVNFADKSFQSSNPHADLDSMMNAYHYTYNGATGSVAQYYYDQSQGTYRPHFDVVGPVTLPNTMYYYGNNGFHGTGADLKAGDMVLDACRLVSQTSGINMSDYDSNGDGYIDFLYLIYAGYGEANGGGVNTIWPASWDMESTIYYGSTSLQEGEDGDWKNTALYSFGGVTIGNYAYSQELDGAGHGGVRSGIGTPTHEFGHVLGLPDFYDIYYGTNDANGKTPSRWDLMDTGSYNNDNKTPPNLSPWEKAFLGWTAVTNPGNGESQLTLYPNGSESQNCYQINSNGIYQDCRTEQLCYYIENRQHSGWDTHTPGHGLVIWKVNYNQAYWEANEPNASQNSIGDNPVANTRGLISYTVVSASGSTQHIGERDSRYNYDTFPGYYNETSWYEQSAKQLTNIVEQDGIVTLTYMEGQDTAIELLSPKEQSAKILLNGRLYLRQGNEIIDILGNKR